MKKVWPVERLQAAASLTAGLLVLGSFFLFPWIKGPAVLGSETYSGFELVRLATIFSELNLPTGPTLVLTLIRVMLLAIPVAAVWVMLLGVAHRWHWGFRLARAYLVFAAVLLAVLGLAGSGEAVPEFGIALLLVAALLSLASLTRARPAPGPGDSAEAPASGSSRLPLGQETQERFVP